MTVIWDERLITRERAANLCGTWAIKLDYPYLRCGICDGNITRLPADGKLFDLDTLISAGVRHMCMNHDYNLSGVGNEGKGPQSPAASGTGGSRGGDLAGHTVH